MKKLFVNSTIVLALLVILAHFVLATLPVWLYSTLVLLAVGLASIER